MNKPSDLNVMLVQRDGLIQKIQGTNNGYLFAPTTVDVYIATLFPDHFSINYAPLAKDFPFRISNK